MSPNIEFFGKEIPLYGILFYTGIAVAAAVAALVCKRKKIDRFDLACSAIYTMIGAVIGAKLLFIAISIDDIIRYQIPLSDVIKGGFVFYGGLLGGILGLFIYCKQFKEKFMQYAELFATVLPLGHAFGRVGCFFAGCCYGMPYDGHFSYAYSAEYFGYTPVGVPLLPVQLIEAGCLLLIFVFMIILYFKTKDQYGLAPIIYLMIYSVLRFVLEFFRGDAVRGTLLGVSTSQWVSILLILAAVAYLIYFRCKKRPLTYVAESSSVPATSNSDEPTKTV
ncbi:MAG: prolipoprotein diacylglyceryl transferase [Clostridia bacterium]|nr:prolipoprotein diacylglyceryl transferase [Clostridia bacterium]